MAAQGTIKCVSQRATQYQTEGQRLAALARLPQHPDQPHGSRDRDGQEEPALPSASAGKKTEGGPWVQHMDQVEKRRDRVGPAQRRGGVDRAFCGLVGGEDGEGEREPGSLSMWIHSHLVGMGSVGGSGASSGGIFNASSTCLSVSVASGGGVLAIPGNATRMPTITICSIRNGMAPR